MLATRVRYRQQLIKLAAHRALPELSSTYVVWDSDQWLVRPLWLVRPARSPAAGWRLRIGVGGQVLNEYCPAARALLGPSIPCLAPLGLVTHQMVARASIMEELLQHICPGGRSTRRCVERILKLIPSASDPQLGLSEYLTYLSFALAHLSFALAQYGRI